MPRAWDSRWSPRTQEWFDLAIERGLTERIEGAEVGHEMRALAREDNPVATLKLWESHDMLAADSSGAAKTQAGLRQPEQAGARAFNLYARACGRGCILAVAYYTLGRLKSREAAAALRHLEFRSAEIEEAR